MTFTEIKNVKNLRIFSMKTEAHPTNFLITNTENFFFCGHGKDGPSGNPIFDITNSNKIVLANVNPDTHGASETVIENYQSSTYSIGGQYNAALFKRGDVDMKIFDDTVTSYKPDRTYGKVTPFNPGYIALIVVGSIVTIIGLIIAIGLVVCIFLKIKKSIKEETKPIISTIEKPTSNIESEMEENLISKSEE